MGTFLYYFFMFLSKDILTICSIEFLSNKANFSSINFISLKYILIKSDCPMKFLHKMLPNFHLEKRLPCGISVYVAHTSCMVTTSDDNPTVSARTRACLKWPLCCNHDNSRSHSGPNSAQDGFPSAAYFTTMSVSWTSRWIWCSVWIFSPENKKTRAVVLENA